MLVNIERLIELIDELVLYETGRKLKQVDQLVIRGAWEAKTYEWIADNCQYSLGYIKQAAAPKLWKLLSVILDEDISKTNFRVSIENKWQQLEEKFEVKSNAVFTEKKLPDCSVIASEIPKIDICYGRYRELELLYRWIIQDNCRLIGISGMGGVGKTTLAVSCVEKVKNGFELIIWQDLQYFTSIEELLSTLIKTIKQEQEDLVSEHIEELIFIFIDLLSQQRCLIVLDISVALISSVNSTKISLDFGRLIRVLGQKAHQSCLLLLTREKQREIAILQGEKKLVRSLFLKGLGTEAQEILKNKNLLNSDRWDELINIYRGNPLALKIVANTIEELFAGSVAAFLKQKTIVFGKLIDLLDEQLENLSVWAIEILYWLALNDFPLSLSQLTSCLVFMRSQAELIEALELLLRRSLIARKLEAGEILFFLSQPVVKEYIYEQICQKICQEIQQISQNQKLEQLQLLRSLALTHDFLEKDYSSKKSPKSLIVQLIADRLCKLIRNEQLAAEKLVKLLTIVSENTFLVGGYAQQNLEALLVELQFQFPGISEELYFTQKLI